MGYCSVNRKANEETIISLKRTKRNIFFDEVPVFELSSDQLDLKRFQTDYQKTSGKSIDNERLQNLGLIIGERNVIVPTHAVVLLSDSESRARLFPYAKVECARLMEMI